MIDGEVTYFAKQAGDGPLFGRVLYCAQVLVDFFAQLMRFIVMQFVRHRQITVVTISRMLRCKSRSSVMGEHIATSAARIGGMPFEINCAA